MLVDQVTIGIQAGDGGSGAVAFRGNRYTDKAAPCGGDGGSGGDIIFRGSVHVSDLREFQYKKSVVASPGQPGKKNNHFGKQAKDTTIFVPLGTTITDIDTHDVWEIVDEESSYVLAKGGRGGKGNYSFRTEKDILPDHAESGEKGEKRTLSISLRMIADIGLIGLPNAGKSSLLAALTNAKPEVAAYPFTTLSPNIGMMGKIAIADIPGLIEGASKGKGLGIQFLKHIEKTSVLVHCIDASAPNVSLAYETVRKELSAFSVVLSEKKEIILLTKWDMVEKNDMKEIQSIFISQGKDVYTCSIYDANSIKTVSSTISNLISMYMRE